MSGLGAAGRLMTINEQILALYRSSS